jgi:hypothetical protein
MLVLLAATSAQVAIGATTSTNPASTGLGPVSTRAQPATSGVGGVSRSSGTAGGAAAPGAGAGGASTPGAAAGGTTTPTTTVTPSARSTLPQIGTAAAGSGSAPLRSTPAGTPGRTAARHSGGLSTAAIALAALAALVALACAVWGVARLLAYEPRWTLSARHAVAEVGFRASSTWAEFSDWIRLGR